MKKMAQKVYRWTPDFIKIFYYYTIGRHRPWSGGYITFKLRYIKKILENEKLLKDFKNSSPLPRGYGLSLDERVIEYPWVLSRIFLAAGEILLDVGSSLNYKPILNFEALQDKKITILNLSPEDNRFSKISYVVGDIRNLPFDSNSFDLITCISTLEHVGLDNTRYASEAKNLESRPRDFEKAVGELKRVAKPNAKVFITVPFGKYQNFRWFQQFDSTMIREIIKTFAPKQYQLTYYKYGENGWNISDESACLNSEYRSSISFASAVACLELIK